MIVSLFLIKFNKWQSAGNANVIYLDKKHQTSSFVSEIVNKLDPEKIYINGVLSRFFSILPVYLFHKKYKLIVAPRGMLGDGALAIKRKRKYLYLQTIKHFTIYNKVLWHANSTIELSEIKRFFSVKNYKVIPNLSKDYSHVSYNMKNKNDTVRFVSVCRVNSIKNIDFFLEVLSDIKFNCSYNIVGSREYELYYNKLLARVSTLPSNISEFYWSCV